MEVYKTGCDLCPSEFNTTTALLKHRETKHSGALEVAKAKAHGRATNRSPTLQIQIVIGRGEGRATREFEIIWWPEMSSTSNHRKLTLRFCFQSCVMTLHFMSIKHVML